MDRCAARRGYSLIVIKFFDAVEKAWYERTVLATRTTRGRVVSTIVVWSNGSGDPNDTRAGRRHNRSIFPDLRDGMQYRLYGVIFRGRGAHVPKQSMVKRVLRPERREGAIRYSCSVHWTSLAPADSVLRTCLRFTSPQSQHLS